MRASGSGIRDGRSRVHLPLGAFADAPLGRRDLIATKPLQVALVNMPWARTTSPSIQCGLLKAVADQAGHQVQVFYLNLELALEIGPRHYEQMVAMPGERQTLLGEWLFTTAAFGYRADEDSYRMTCGGLAEACERLDKTFEELCIWRNELFPQVIRSWASRDWGTFDVVGFTSTFEQNVASLALARHIKERYPGVKTVFGGANFDGDMGPEYVRVLPWIDFAVIGEGEIAFPLLLRQIAEGNDSERIPGVCSRKWLGESSSARIQNLDELPDPDYSDYFTTLERLGQQRVLGKFRPFLNIETSRGCWWGEKHHCTFCGLNALGMDFRAKSPTRAIGEMERLASRYRVLSMQAVDNIISPSYLDRLCPELSERHYDFRLFYEVKANLTRHQVKALFQAGIDRIQPGIESFSTHVLRLMRKGTTKLINIRLLRWAFYYGVRVSWNVLTGFPGETDDDYKEQADLVPLLYHLPPPRGCGPIWLERFSPYFFDSDFAIRNRRAKEVYRYAYPVSMLDSEKIAYYFDFEADDVATGEATNMLSEAIGEWQRRWQQDEKPLLYYERGPDWVTIGDSRGGEGQRHSIEGWSASAYEYCSETFHSAERVEEHLRADTSETTPTTEEVQKVLKSFCDQGLMVEEDGHFLSLAIPISRHW